MLSQLSSGSQTLKTPVAHQHAVPVTAEQENSLPHTLVFPATRELWGWLSPLETIKMGLITYEALWFNPHSCGGTTPR